MSDCGRTGGPHAPRVHSPTVPLLGIDAGPLTSLELYTLVRQGFLLDRVMGMVSSSQLFETANVLGRIVGSSDLGIMRRRKSGFLVRLNARQSTVAFQYAQAMEDAIKVFGSQGAAEEWLEKPCKYLAGEVPLDMVESWWGFQSVQEYLQRIEAGVYQ